MSDPYQDPYGPYTPPSAYPPGQAQPAYYGQVPGPAAPSGSAKAAAVLLGVVGALTLLGGGLIALGLVAARDEVVNELATNPELAEATGGLDPSVFVNVMAGCFGICGGIVGIVFLALMPFVWKQKKGGIITAMVAVSLVGVLLLVQVAGGLVTGEIVGSIAMLLPVILLGITLFLLIRALSSAPSPQAAYAQQQAQWQQYAQQQGTPYGYPPSPQQPPQQGWGEPPADRNDRPGQ